MPSVILLEGEIHMHLETKLVQAGVAKDERTGAISFPVYNATAYRHPALGQSTGYDYTRTANPTRTVLEQTIAEAEGGDAGFACASGMAAIHTVMGLFSQGDHLVVSLDLYGGTYRLFEQVLSRYGLRFSYVDLRDVKNLEEAIRPETRAVFVETPTNPLMQITDIAAVAEAAKRNGLLTIVDNTFMTPYCQRPLELGADLVLHSATKYLGGHNDVLAGLIVTKGEELSEKIRFLHNSIGAVLGPQDCWLLLRGMKTLALRMERHQANALAIVKTLREHPAVTDVYYPGLPEHPLMRCSAGRPAGSAGWFRSACARLNRWRRFWRAYGSYRLRKAWAAWSRCAPIRRRRRMPTSRKRFASTWVCATGCCGCRSGSNIPTT